MIKSDLNRSEPDVAQTQRKETQHSADRAGKSVPLDHVRPDQFLLEDLFPVPAQCFLPYDIEDIAGGDSIVVLDTNTLLVPYGIKPDDLTALEGVYKQLAGAERLLIPSRVAREFIKHRDTKLAEMLKAISDQKSRLQIPQKRLSPLLEGVTGYAELSAAHDELMSARSKYDSTLSKLMDRLRSWRGNDPVTSLYRSLFSGDVIVELEEKSQDLAAEWSVRLQNRTPPGFKDEKKDDLGIGDFLIWKTILQIGAKHQRDLVFVTGEDKSDWLVQSNNTGVYPRPELVDEYRRWSGGKCLAILSLSAFLADMKVSSGVVQEIKTAEGDSPKDHSTASSRYRGFRPSELRAILRQVFPGRRKGTRESIQEFRLELLLSGYTTASSIEDVLLRYKKDALASEGQNKYETFFTDVGIGREAMKHADSGFESLINQSFSDKESLLEQADNSLDDVD